MATYTRQSKKREQQQIIVDDFTKCRGLTQDELDQDLKLLQLAKYTTPSTKYKLYNPLIDVKKRKVITDIYDRKNISLDLAKTNGQLMSELKALKHDISSTKNSIIHNQTQIEISKLKREIITKQFELIQTQKNTQIESLKQYQTQCKQSIAQTQTELHRHITNAEQITIAEQSLINALHTIKDLKTELQNKTEIIAIIQKKELLQSTNQEMLKLNEKFDSLDKIRLEQRKTNNTLRAENKQILRELSETKASYQILLQKQKELNNDLVLLKYASNEELQKYNAESAQMRDEMNILESERNKYKGMCAVYESKQNESEVMNAYMSLNYFNQLLANNGLRKGNALLQSKYNALHSENNQILTDKENKNKYELENTLILEKKRNGELVSELQCEKQKYFHRIITLKDDLDLLYLRTERTVKENNSMKQSTKKKTFELQRENDKLRNTLKASHSNALLNDCKHKQKNDELNRHKNDIKMINGNKIDLEKRVDILKKAIKDLNGVLGDCHIQMLAFQKQVYDEMNCSMPKDSHLMIGSAHKSRFNHLVPKQSSSKSLKKHRKRQREGSHSVSMDSSEISNHLSHKRRKLSTTQSNNKLLKVDNDIVDSSSSSEISHGSHLTDDELYHFQGSLTNELNNGNGNANKSNEKMVFYSILSNTKTESYILLNEYIKITRRGHPDYTGRVESMFWDKENNKKKVCVTIFQLASDIPNLKELYTLRGDTEGKREYIQLILHSKKYKQYKGQKENTKVFGVGRIHTNKKVTLWFPKKDLKFKSIEKKTSGRDVYFCRYKYDKGNKTLIRIDGTDDQPNLD